MFSSAPSDPKTFEEAKAALRTPFLSEDIGVQALQVLARGLSPEDAALFTASLEFAQKQGFKQGLKLGLEHPTTVNNTNHNSGQQQGVVLGDGTATVKHSQQTNSSIASDDGFDQSQFRTELIEVLGLVVDRIEAIEGDSASAAQVLVALRKADLSQAKTLDDVRTMLEDLWDSKMKTKYSTLRSLFASDGVLMEAIKASGQIAKLLGALTLST